MILKSDNGRLFKQQKQCVRIITGSRYNSHTDPLFKKTRILKSENVITVELKEIGQKMNLDFIPDTILRIFPERNEKSHTN